MEVLPSTLKALEEVLVTWSRLQSAVCELREDLEPSNAPHLIFRGTGHARDLTSPISLWPLSPAQQPHLEGIPGFFCGVQNWHCEGLLDKCLHRMQKVGGHSCLCDLTVSGGESTWSKGSFSRRRKSNSDLVAARHRPSQVKHLSVQSTMHRRFSQPQEQVLVSRQDIINKKDAWEKQEFIRMSIQYMLQHPAFQLLLALLLVTNAITIALRTNSFFDQKHFELFSVIDDIVLTTLICEVLLRWLSGFWIFWQDGWNVLNFFIVCMLVLGVLNMVNVSITYCLRVLRLVHVCMAVEPLARIIRVILQAGPGMAQIGVLILFVMLVFALLGVTLFGEFVPTHFGNLGVALYTLFVCLTQDGWVDIYDDFRMKERDYALETGGAIYFAIFIIIGGIIGMNLLVTVVIRNLEQIMKTEEQEQQHQKNFSETGAEKEDWSHELPLLHCAVARMEKSGLHQEPLVGSPMSNLSENMLDNFCLVLEAIEENVTQYKKIREELDNIVQKVRSIPFNQEQMEELLRRLMSMSLMDSGSSMDLHNIAKQQDLFTALVSRAKVYESLTNMALSKQKFSS